MLRLVALLFVVALAGCDAADPADTRTDEERIVGTWDASTANVRVRGLPFGIPVADLANAGDDHTFVFRTDDTFTFRFDPADGRRVSIPIPGTDGIGFPLNQTVALSGTYTLDDSTDKVTFSTVAGQTVDDFRMGYSFRSATLELSAEDAQTLSRLFGLADADAARIAEVLTGGSITYSSGS